MTTKTAIFTTAPFDGVPNFIQVNNEQWAVKLTTTANNSLNGKINTHGTFTLAASTVSTEVKFVQGIIGDNTKMLWYPTTANAAANAYDGSMFLSTVDPTNYIMGLTHTSDANTNKTFAFILIG